jgi:murein DD-endopeptidase MepM/ murein hydrolase activator NlpD
MSLLSQRFRSRLLLALLPACFLLAACGLGSGATVAEPDGTLPPVTGGAPTATGVVALARIRTTATPLPGPTAVLAAAAPTATSTPVASASPVPEPTVSPGAGLPCPAEPPVKPAYLSYNLSMETYPTPDPSVAAAPLSLPRPVDGEGPLRLNLDFPYGSDGGGRYLLHTGLDSTEPLGTPVVAVGDGTVVVAGPDAEELFGWRCDWYGQLVVIQLDEPWQGQPVFALYGHVLNVMVEAGQRVKVGDPLAEIGYGGVATAPHLHFEVRVGANRFNTTRNPALWLEPADPYGVLAGRLVDVFGHPWEGVTVTLITLGEETQFINTSTYLDDPDDLINPEPGLAENFVYGQLPAGEYDLYVKLQDVEYRQRVVVSPGDLTTVEIVTEAYKTPTPGPSPTLSVTGGTGPVESTATPVP